MKKLITIVTVIAIVAMLACVLCACAPKDGAAATTKLKDAGYSVATDSVVIPAAIKLATKVNVDTVLTATDGDEAVTAILCSSTDDAKTVYNWCKDEDGKTDVKKSGKWVYYGTAAGMKAFTK